MTQNRIVLWRDRVAGTWMATYDDGTSVSLQYSSMEKAGTIAAIVAKANPNSQIGIRSNEIGPWTMITLGYEPVLWMRPDWRPA